MEDSVIDPPFFFLYAPFFNGSLPIDENMFLPDGEINRFLPNLIF
jgi:hypothetical protein